uniref:Uncharacterized protein n=1 Tax=Vitrella brassicaformis TaxID=1169539 RepID=A0A7S1PCX0_9ALVE
MDDFELQEDFAEDGSPSSSRMYRHRRQRQSLDAPDSSPGPMLVERPSTSDGVSRSRPASGVDEPDEDEEEEDEGEEEEDEEAGDVFW